VSEIVMAVDPSLTNTAWVMLTRNAPNRPSYLDSGMARHDIAGRGKWKAKTRRILKEMNLAIGFDSRCRDIVTVYVEKPHFGSRGRDEAALVSLVAIMDLAWQIAWDARRYTDNVIVCEPDHRSKAQRSLHLDGLIECWPKRTNEHVRDAAWIALKGC